VRSRAARVAVTVSVTALFLFIYTEIYFRDSNATFSRKTMKNVAGNGSNGKIQDTYSAPLTLVSRAIPFVGIYFSY